MSRMGPIRLTMLRLAALGCAALGTIGSSVAQGNQAVCQQIRFELASVERGAGPSPGAQQELARLRADLARAQNAMRQNECGSRGFLVFGGPAPVCGPLQAQAAQISGRIQQLGGAGGNPRRAQLVAALDRYGCNSAPPQQQARGVIYANPNEGSLFDRLFGRGSDGIVDGNRSSNPDLDAELEQKARLGGRTAVCVRTCDGFFFPVNFEGLTARDEHGSVCQALCPSAETQVYYMRLGGEIETAATRDGRPYTALPTARAYQEKRNEACICKPTNVTWAEATKGTADLVEARKGDIILTREQAAAMSRPKDLRGNDLRGTTPANRRNAPAAQSASGPTPEPAVPVAPGVVQDVIGPDGQRRQIRVVAPGLAGQ